MMRPVAALLLLLTFVGVSGQMVQPIGPGAIPNFGPVSIQITAPETGTGLGPKKDVGEEFDLAFKLQLANLTITNISMEILMFDDTNETYVPFNDEWIVDRANVSWESLRGPTVSEGYFRIKIPERGYYFLKIRANYSLDGRPNAAEGGDIIFGPRIRVIPGISEGSYLVLLGMPIVPLVLGLSVRMVRRRETRKRRQKPGPQWLEQLKREQEESEKEVNE